MVSLSVALVCFAAFSFTLHRKITSDIWSQLGISQATGAGSIRNSFINGYAEYYSLRKAKNIATGNRAAIAKDLLEYTRKYLAGPEIKKHYEKERASTKPVQPEIKEVSKEAIREEKIKEMEKAIVNTQELIAKMPDLKKDGEKNIADFKRTIAEYKKPDNQMINLFYDAEVKNAEMDMERYRKSIVEWEKSYPENPNVKLQQYIKKYLSIASTVDFDAELVERYGKKVFKKPAYESKSGDWKLIFRAGREVYDVAKPFAESWLREL